MKSFLKSTLLAMLVLGAVILAGYALFLATGRSRRRVNVSDIHWSPDGRYVAVGRIDSLSVRRGFDTDPPITLKRRIDLYRHGRTTPIWTLGPKGDGYQQDDQGNHIAGFDSRGDHVYVFRTTGRTSYVHEVDIATRQDRLIAELPRVYYGSALTDGRLLFAASEDPYPRKLSGYEIDRGKISRLPFITYGAIPPPFGAGGRYALCGDSADTTRTIWDTGNWTAMTVDINVNQVIMGFSSDEWDDSGPILISRMKNNGFVDLLLLNDAFTTPVATTIPLSPLPGLKYMYPSHSAISTRAGMFAATVRSSNDWDDLFLWDLHTHSQLKRIEMGCSSGCRPAFSPDGRWLAYATAQGVSAIDTKTLKEQVIAVVK